MARQKYLLCLFFSLLCYIVVIVKSYKLRLAAVDLQSWVFSDMFFFYNVPAP